MDWDKLYFNFLVDKVATRSEAIMYSDLLHFLSVHSFIVSLPMDGNRAADGLELRTEFAQSYKSGIHYHSILNGIDQVECSILEMLVALSVRIERDIMNDDFIGDRTGLWFWAAIDSVGIKWPNEEFDKFEADEKIDICMERGYDYEGHGSFFTVHNPPRDMRTTDIWYQANWWLMYEFEDGLRE